MPGCSSTCAGSSGKHSRARPDGRGYHETLTRLYPHALTLRVPRDFPAKGRAAYLAVATMAEPLENQYGPEEPRRIGAMPAATWPCFPLQDFVADALAGHATPKVSKLKALELAPGATKAVRRRISLANLTTRPHHPGHHGVEALLNGVAHPLGHFVLAAR